jgi:hypothetical protein
MGHKDPSVASAYNKTYYKAHKEERQEYGRKYREAHRDESRLYNKTYGASHRTKTREWVLRTKYSMTLAEYNELLASQNGVCAICLGNETYGKAMPVDHDHTTGKVRGLLCHECNRALGIMKDDPALLRAAADYLERNIVG